jgi:hypothetical protein
MCHQWQYTAESELAGASGSGKVVLEVKVNLDFTISEAHGAGRVHAQGGRSGVGCVLPSTLW